MKMKAEKNIISKADFLKKIQEILKRISDEKNEIRREIESIEAELNARKTVSIQSNGFNVKEILEYDNNETVESLKRKIAKLKNALTKPNYADAEFRKYSLIYLMEYLNEHSVEKKRINEELAKLNNEYYNLRQKMREIEGKKNNIIDGFARKMIEIGLSKETEGIGLYGAEYIMSRYEERCKEYEI